MAKKTNKSSLDSALWCQRYGTDLGGKGPCRGANPLSCAQCTLQQYNCPGYQHIKTHKVIVQDNQDTLAQSMTTNGCFFGVLTTNNTPREVWVLNKKGDDIVPRDFHTGLKFKTSTNIARAGLWTVNDLVETIQKSHKITPR